jgi:hypothetical protein
MRSSISERRILSLARLESTLFRGLRREKVAPSGQFSANIVWFVAEVGFLAVLASLREIILRAR